MGIVNCLVNCVYVCYCLWFVVVCVRFWDDLIYFCVGSCGIVEVDKVEFFIISNVLFMILRRLWLLIFVLMEVRDFNLILSYEFEGFLRCDSWCLEVVVDVVDLLCYYCIL